MTTCNNSYDFIKEKISSLKSLYPKLRSKSDSYVFSALCVKSNLYKNPALLLSQDNFEEIIVDSKNDGGVDILLTDPNSETSDLVIAQSKYYTSITYEDVLNAILKMISFYNDMNNGNYESVNSTVQSRFTSLNSDVGEESKLHFIFYTSAPQAGINRSRLEKKFREHFSCNIQYDISFYFDKDIEEEIKESESRRPTVEEGKIKIDQTGNYLLYGDNAAIVNVSAFSIKALYAQYNIQLLARNLRYHIKGTDIDKGIKETIKENPESFWLKNNGITIICDNFDIDSKEVKLRNFSIINGGQTTYLIHKSPEINESNDFYLPCKLIKNEGTTEDEKNSFSLAIAKATNTQKPIKNVDLKANSPEQVRFAQAMREIDIYYLTKRGEVIPPNYRSEIYLNTSLTEIGKLYLAAIFQLPCSSRSKPSMLYLPQYYERIYNSNQKQYAKLGKELLYIDYYFKKIFLNNYEKENADMPGANEKLSFARNARTICIAFVAFASRYYQGNIDDKKINDIFSFFKSDNLSDSRFYDITSDLGNISYFIKPEIFNSKDKYDELLNKLFHLIINCGSVSFSMASRYDPTLTATNYLKKDSNYFAILFDHWSSLRNDIKQIFNEIYSQN